MGEALRRVLLQKDLEVFPLSELLLFMAIRVQHIEELIMPALSAGGIVLCDRFTDATYAYQGYGRGTDLGIIGTLNRLVTKGVTPNLTILVDCPAEVGSAGSISTTPNRTGSRMRTFPFIRRSGRPILSSPRKMRGGSLWWTENRVSRQFTRR